MEEYADDSFLCFRVLQFPSLQGNSPAPNEYDLVTAYWRKVKKLVKKFGLFSVECGGRTKGIAILDESSYKNLGSPHLYISYKCGMPYVAWFPKKTV